ncbi:DUF6221 family protein [Streptomyces sp. NPDC006975]|uniref:DUF6221 family protein n=1 Tax=Streptomyces sp. NPDC006975 TaxID=3154310 RepID=UPI003456FD10
MEDLILFLRARLDEDERYAHSAKGLIGVENPWWTWDALKNRFPSLSRGDAQHIERHGPMRVLREIDAKRRLLAIHRPYVPEPDMACLGCAGGIMFTSCPVVRLLALPYADHPNYREEWRA